MKKLFTSLLLMSGLILASMSSTQAFNVVTTNATDWNTCDGSAYIDSNSVGNVSSWTWYDSVGTFSIVGGYYLDSLCPGMYWVEYLDSGVTNYFTFVIGADSGSNPCANFYVSASAANYADSGVCNGTASVNISGGSGSYTYAWSPSGGNLATATGLCGNTNYTVSVSDNGNGCSGTSSVYIGEIIDSTNWISSLYVYVSTTDATNDSICDGTATVSVSGGTPPYYYVFNTPDSSNTSSASNLCPGVYEVTVYDNANNATTYTFMISDDSSVYSNGNNYPDSTIIDTVSNNPMVDCDIEYDSIATIEVTNYSFTDSMGLDSSEFFMLEWTITYLNGSETIVEEYYLFDGYGVYLAYLNMYCNTKSGFYGRLKASDFVNVQEITNGIDPKEEPEATIFPNPVADQMNIKMDGYFNYEIFDLRGVRIDYGTAQNLTTINTVEFTPNLYLVKITDGTGRSKITKILVQ